MEKEKKYVSKKIKYLSSYNKIIIKIIFKVILFFSIFQKYSSNSNFIYPNAITLLDGNIFIIHKFGIDIYDPTLTIKIKNVITFSDEDQIKNEDIYSKTSISIFNENEYMICGINDKIYIFNFFGEKIYNSDYKLHKFQDELYSLIPIKIYNNEFFYSMGFINNNNTIQLLFFKYDNIKRNISLLHNESYLNNTHNNQKPLQYLIQKNGLSCQLMKYYHNTNIIVCIYYVNSQQNYLTNLFINPENYSLIESIKNNKIQLSNDINDIRGIKTTINSDYSKMFICFYITSGKLYCLIYSINNNSFSNYTEYFDSCKSQYSEIKLNYIKENKQYLLSCIDDNSYINLISFNNNFEYLNKYKINNCIYNYGYSIIYSSITEEYIIVFDKSDQKYNNFFSQLKDNESLKYTKLRKTQSLIDCGDNIKCKTCSYASISKGLCVSCNNEGNYFPLKPDNSSQQDESLINCYNNSTKPNNFYFNKEEQYYQPCYWTCGSCQFGGDGIQNNCTSCAMDYTEDPEIEGNCVVLCKNFYYYTLYNQYKCSSSPQCPEEKSLLIRKRRKCIDSCLKDEIYKYQYNGECLKECPIDTKTDTNDNICKVIDKEACSKSTSQFDLYDFLKEGGVEKIVKIYAKEFVYTDKHISLFKNEVYSIMLYKNAECITELELPMPEIDFGACYTKVQEKYKIKNSLIIAIIDKISNKKNNPITSYSFYNPETGEKLDSEAACKEEVIVVKENIKSLLNDSVSDMESILFLTDQNIDIFNKSSGFFTDLCYHFESPCNKDVALNDRLLVYYPNITLCDSGCTNTGVNLTSMTAICECKYKEMTDEEEEEDTNLYQDAVNEVYNILNQINLGVMACYKDIFEYKYFVSCTGGIIILCLFFIQIINYIIYYYIGFFYVKKYIYNITDNFILYLNKSPMYKTFINKLKDNDKQKNDEENEKEENAQKENNENKSLKKENNNNSPPKKNLSNKNININIFAINNNKNSNVKFHKSEKHKKMLTQEGSDDKNSSNIILNGKGKKSAKTNLNITKTKFDKSLISFKSHEKSSTNPIFNDSDTKQNISFFDEYLSTQLNDMRFNDALIKDKRLFFDYFCDKLKRNQIILSLILINDPIKPKTIKLLILILDIEICFVINAMFINEDYISKIFRSTKEENFISFLPRSINRIIYTIIASIVFSYIIGCLFIREKRLKSIFRYEQKNQNAIKYEISLIMKEMKWRYNIFIILTVVASLYSWYYLSCFNNIYPHTKIEWIKSSILVILLIHIISIIVILAETLLRFISFEIKSEKMYKASLWLA